MEDVFYGINGKEQDKEENAYARKTDKLYYVKEYMGTLFKKGVVIQRINKDRFKWRKVGELCFKNYVQYLETNQEPRYLIACRNMSQE